MKTLLRVCACALTLTGCVSVQSLEQDLKSSDSQKKIKAEANLSRIITKGKILFTEFSTAERLWCAQQLTDKNEIIKVIKTMTCRYADPQASENVRVAIEGMANEDNAPILDALLNKVKNNQQVFKLLTCGTIQSGATQSSRAMKVMGGRDNASEICKVALKFMQEYVNNITDKKDLYEMEREFSNWRNISSSYGCSMYLHEEMDEQIIPKRIIAIASSVEDVKEFLTKRAWSDEFKNAVISKISNDRDLVKLLPIDKSLVLERISDTAVLTELALNESSENEYGWNVGVGAVEKLTDKNILVNIALLAKNKVVSNAARKKIGDNAALIDGIVALLKSKKISEKDIVAHVKALQEGEATISLYDVIEDRMVKQEVFAKLTEENRKIIRANNVKKCEKLIRLAEEKGKNTFALGGFYLGMDIADVDLLIGYHFPDWSTSEKLDPEDESIRVVWVPQQSRPFCRADKDGKVCELNFGKSVLKKFFKYDVQNEKEWARAYSRQHGVDMKYVRLNKETTVNVPQADFSFKSYKAWLSQITYQWKNNAKGYRLTYYAEPEIETAWGDVIKQQASYQFRFISCDAGTLRASVDND